MSANESYPILGFGSDVAVSDKVELDGKWHMVDAVRHGVAFDDPHRHRPRFRIWLTLHGSDSTVFVMDDQKLPIRKQNTR